MTSFVFTLTHDFTTLNSRSKIYVSSLIYCWRMRRARIRWTPELESLKETQPTPKQKIGKRRAVWRKPSSNSPGGVPQETGPGPQSPLESPLFVAQDPSENGFGPGSGEGDERLPGPSAFPQTQPQSELGDGLTTSPRDFPGAGYWQCAFGTQNTLTQEEEAEDAPISFDF